MASNAGEAQGFGFNRWLWLIAAAMAYAVLLRPEQGLLAATVIPAMLWMVWRPTTPSSTRDGLSEASLSGRTRRPLRRASTRALGGAELANLPCPAAARAALRDRSPESSFRSAFSAGIAPGPSTSLRPKRSTGTTTARPSRSATCPPGPSTPTTSTPGPQLSLNDYNRTYNATPALDVRFEALAEERIHDDPLRYYVALPVARLLNMIFRPRAEMLEIPLEWWQWREHRETTLLAAVLAALNLGYFVLGGIGLWRWRRSGLGPHAPLVAAMVGFVVLRCASAADARQLGAALHAGVLPAAHRVGKLSLSLGLGKLVETTLVLVVRGLGVRVDLVWLLIDLLVVLDVVVDRGSIVP